MGNLWRLGGLTPLQFLKVVWAELNEDYVWGHSAELAYYFMLALFPAAIMLLTVIGFVAGPESGLRAQLVSSADRLMPASSAGMVDQIISGIHRSATTWGIVIGLLGAIWSASAGMTALINTLNIVYDVKETRSWWKSRAVAVALTIGFGVLTICALVLFLYGPEIATSIASKVGLGGVVTMLWKLLQWPVAIFFMLLAFALLYYFAPNYKETEWFWASPGAVVALTVWIAASIGFRVYLQYFNSYNKTYGSLGAVIILMLWLYLTGAAILIGGEVNAVLDHANRERLRGRDYRTPEAA